MRTLSLTAWAACVAYCAGAANVKSPYCVIDLSAGTSATSYPVTYLDAVPTGGWTDEYKTSKLVLRRISAGTFTMGCDNGTAAAPAHSVTLTKPFYIGVFELTQKQFTNIMGEGLIGFTFSGDTLPVDGISYNYALTSFVSTLATRTGIAISLPTEAQWEYACRAGTTTAFSYGDTEDGDYMWYKSNCESRYHPVGSKLPNPWGLYDMHGNVREFCLDWYSSSYSSDAATDPTGAASGTFRVTRGGSYSANSSSSCTSYARGSASPGTFTYSNGLRVSWTLAEADAEEGPTATEVKTWLTGTAASTYAAGHGMTEEEYCTAFETKYGSDYAAALTQETGKVAADGTELTVYADYVAGTDPLDTNDLFTAAITCSNGIPIVTWSPELSATDAALRTYTTYGKVTLTNDWTDVTNLSDIQRQQDGYHFFKVSVDLKSEE